MEIGKSAGKSFAYILGVYLGDGCVTGNGGDRLIFRVNTIDPDFADAIKIALGEIVSAPVSIRREEVKKSSKPNYALCCSAGPLCHHLLNVTRDKQCIPDEVLSWPIEQQQAFVIGLMDSEGFVAEKTEGKTGRAYYMGFKSCDVWVPEFVRLLEKMGVRIGKVSQCPPYKEGYKVPTRFHIKMQSWVDSGMRFNIVRKQSRVDRWAATEPYSERVRFPRRLSSETTRQPG